MHLCVDFYVLSYLNLDSKRQHSSHWRHLRKANQSAFQSVVIYETSLSRTAFFTAWKLEPFYLYSIPLKIQFDIAICCRTSCMDYHRIDQNAEKKLLKWHCSLDRFLIRVGCYIFPPKDIDLFLFRRPLSMPYGHNSDSYVICLLLQANWSTKLYQLMINVTFPQ